LKAFVSELNRLWDFIDQTENHSQTLHQRKVSVPVLDEGWTPRIRYMKRLLLKLINASKNLQSEAILTECQLSLLEQGFRLLKTRNLNADILKDYSTQLTAAEIDATVRPKSDESMDKLISLYMEKLAKGEA
jgi:hypothetical protein